MSLLISIPTLFRPDRVIETARSAREHTPDARILVSCSPEDRAAPIALAQADIENAYGFTVPWSYTEGADWARKHNRAYTEMTEDWILLAGDDLRFHPGWFEACLDVSARTGACVIGTNDMGNDRVLRGEHSTHPLVHRDYIRCGGVVDDSSRLLPECYGHWYVDDEFVKTAMRRGTYAHAHAALVEHLHPNWGKAQDDETYQIGQRSLAADRLVFERRRRLWT